MIAAKRVLATIPARGGSKRFPGKNLSLLAGKPLLAYSIEAAFACETIDRVVVTTDNDLIAQVAQGCGADVIDRPTELATDDAYIGPACSHALREVESVDKCRYSIHVLLQPTSPLRTADHISAGLEMLVGEGEYDSVLSVRPFADHPYWARIVSDGNLKPFLLDARHSSVQRKQELPPVYYANGALYITYRNVLIDTNDVLGSRIAPLIMTSEESVDVDSEFNLLVAEALLR